MKENKSNKKSILSSEAFPGILLLSTTVLALVLANTPLDKFYNYILYEEIGTGMQVNQSIPTVFAIIYATNGNLNDALYCAIHAGGDTDTIASMVGAILGGLGIYKFVVDFAGSGATVPLTGFGYNLAKGAIEGVKEAGLVGAFTGGVKAASGGIAAAVFFGYLASLISKPKMKKQ